MLSQLKAREVTPATGETGKKDDAASSEKTAVSDAEQQAAARLTCDALCSLANGIKGPSVPSTHSPAAVTPPVPTMPTSISGQPLGLHGFLYRGVVEPVAVSTPPTPPPTTSSAAKTVPIRSTTNRSATTSAKTSTKIKNCPKQHQLPLFLSKTYHMIDRCDPEIATWSASGDNFVVKNVEKFASSVLPLYFKHSNFSSFARQLNFYGFRKLRSDPILTNDVDPQTACYVRFYHEKFQKNKPELLHSIKRATKSDQQSKDDVDDLKSQVMKLKKCVVDMSTQMERKISEISFEYNRRISGLTAEYDKLAGLVGQLLQQQQHPSYIQTSQPPSHVLRTPSHHYVPNPPLPPIVDTATPVPTTSASVSTSGSTTVTSSSVTSASSLSSTNTTATASTIPADQQQKMQSLSQVVAMSLMANASIPGTVMGSTTTAMAIPSPTRTAAKRAAPEQEESQSPPAIRPKLH
eukprot:CAMPEP_0116092512 /NCGR_PEP_ID=MMETSP0327-20121206/8085_1 /TAXON_ID=44447 /ORGANISM="Pseudo-nitzschia delicatissima, Strain B596" /LENGTH=463 /DNA_ID=CAMNT_0003583949 /DNA_START=547 /DNA_END=1938 /DNA_ORIENTATION=+